MSSLRETQRAMQAGVLSRDGNASTPASVAETSAASAAERMAVYVHAYGARLAEVLGQDFPGLNAIAGTDRFADLCAAYIAANPSHHYNVRWYGASLAGFLGTAKPWCDEPALAEMAALEWDIGLAFDAIDTVPFDAATMQTVPPDAWPTMRFDLAASLRRSKLHWNVGAIRRALDRDEALPDLERFDDSEPRAVYRKDTIVFHRALETDEAAALDAIAADGTFADVCEALCAWHALDDVAARALTLLKRWIGDEWIAALRVD